MKKNKSLSVREIQADDIPLIADYWLKSEPDFLRSMGVDLDKLPSRRDLTEMLTGQINKPIHKKASYALIWMLGDLAVGHCNVNKIKFGEEAFVHLHLWREDSRQRGLGIAFVRLSLSWFFEYLRLETLFCEPYALNPAPNKTLAKLGFRFEKEYLTVPGSLNFEQLVNRWKLSKLDFEEHEQAYCRP